MDGSVEYPLIDVDEMAGEAWAAMARQDADAALRVWREVRQHFPDRPEGYVWPIQVLWQGGRLDEADKMAAEAFARFPEDPELLVQYAWIAMSRERWDEALRWWAAVRAQAPKRPDGYVWAARALWRSARLEEAATMAAEAIKMFPGNASALAEAAAVAVERRDWPEAVRRWTHALQCDPDRLDVQVGLIQAQRMAGRLDEAERMTTQALERQPDNPDLLTEHVWAAVARDDWTAAAARLETARAKQPDAARFAATLGWVEDRLRLRAASIPSGGGAATGAAGSSTRAGISVTDLMLSFESLGERCDFGAVQRHFGVEPLGLLRFAFTRFDPLIAGLEDRFAAVGTVEDTSFELYKDETILYMRKYGLVFHTFVYQSELGTPEERDTFRQQQLRRLLFLKNKLISDLEEPQKIYIYASDERAADADVLRLFKALRAYGPNTLLYVRPAGSGRRLGKVEPLQEGLFTSYYPGLTDFVAGNQPPMELWRQICERTYRLARTDRAR